MKLLRDKARRRNVVIILVAVLLFFCLRVVLTALIPSPFGMFVYREQTASVTRTLFSGIF